MSSGQQPAQPPQREIVFCHQCREEWFRDEHGLVCPRCMGDFVEILEDRHDHLHGGADNDMPDLLDIDSDDEYPFGHTHGDGAQGPRLNILPGVPGIPGIQIGFSTMQPPGNGGAQTPDAGPDIGDVLLNVVRTMLGERAARHAARAAQRGEGEGQQQQAGDQSQATGTTTTTTTTTTSGGTPITPRTERGEAEQPETIDEFLNRLNRDNGTLDPVAELLAHIFRGPEASGDYVYTQAELDRVITELMEQHQGNAPPPAPKEALDKLPKVKVEEQRVIDGEDCAVCKEDLIIGEEVVQLPCKHVYHELCVKKWLEAHDTCPICRRSTVPHEEGKKPESPAPGSGSGSSGNGQGSPNRLPIPGAWPAFLSALGGGSRSNS